MVKSILLLLFLFVFSILDAQVDLVFPKDHYVFDSTTVHFEWNDFTGATNYEIQIASDSTFSTLIETNNSLTNSSYVSSNLSENQLYFWRVKSNNSTWSSTYRFHTVNFRTWPELEFMLDPDSVVLDVNGKVQQWTDLSGNGHDFVQNSQSLRPIPLLQQSLSDNKVIDFIPADSNYLQGNSLASLTKGEIFLLLKKNFQIPSQSKYAGFWKLSTENSGDVYPYVDNYTNLSFGRSYRISTANTSTNIGDVSNYHILNATSDPGKASYFFNNHQFSTSPLGNVSFPTISYLGLSIGSGSYYFFEGKFGEILLFNTVLSDSLRNLVNRYYQCKYAPPVNLGKRVCGMIPTLHAQKYFKSYLWSDGSTNDSLIVSAAGTYWCKATDIFGNISSDTVEVIAFPSIHQPTLPTYCPGESITWETNMGNGYTYQWSDGSSADSLDISTPGDYYVRVSDTLGCSRLSDTLHFIEDTFNSSISLGSDTAFCQGNTIALQAGASQAVSYLWNTGETTPDIQPQTTGEYSVTATNVNGCVAKDTMFVTINGIAPTIGFSIPLMACTADSITYMDTSYTTDGSTLVNWSWNFGDTTYSNLQQGLHNYPNTGFKQVKLTVTTSNGCKNSLTKTVMVNTSPKVNLVSQFSCEKQAINFSGTQQTPQFMSSWRWNFNDPLSDTNNLALGQNTSHLFSSYGNFNVQLIGTDVNGCTDTAYLIKTIKPAPKPNFTHDEVCAGGTVHFTNTTTIPGANTIQSYNWDFGNGLGSQFTNPQALYNFAGNYNVKLIATGSNGCVNDTTISIRIHDLPVVNSEIINDCALLNSILVDSSTVIDGTLSQVSWQINGTTPIVGKNISYTFSNPGLFEVKQQVMSSFGCQQTKTYYVTIHDALKSDFDVTPDALIAGYPIKFINNSVGATQYQWQFGNYTSASNKDTIITFPDSWIDSTLYIQLVSSNSFGCSDTTHTTLIIQGRSTDLALTKILYQDFDGYLKMGVRLKNNGTTPITSVDLKMEKTGMGIFKEQWNGMLLGGDSTVYVFNALPLNVINDKDSSKNYICIYGTIVQPSQFIEITMDNNQLCDALSTSEAIIIQPFPNPVHDQLTIKVVVPKDIKGKVEIVDANGKLIYSTLDRSFVTGLNNIVINTNGWAKGSYRIWWRGKEKFKAVAFIKE